MKSTIWPGKAQQPVETLESIAFGTLNLLEAIRFTGKATKLYNAG